MSRYNPHYPNAPAVFDAAERFKQRCLLDHESLLIDGAKIWTPPHFKSLIDNYVNQPDISTSGFYDKLKLQLSACSPHDVALMCELFWIVQLAPGNLRPATKVDRLRYIWNLHPPQPFPAASPFLADDVLSGLGSAGPGYNNYLWMELAFAVQAFAEFVARPRDEREALLADGWKFAEWLAAVPSGVSRQFYHTLNHVLFPDLFERIFSQNNKYQVARETKRWQASYYDDRLALDHSLLDLRNELEAQYPDAVDHYEAPVATLRPELLEVPPTTGLADDPRADVDLLAESASSIRPTTNLILYGPPGTGKTHELQRRVAAATRGGEDWVFVAFHPSYSYEDFVGGLRPAGGGDDGHVRIRYEKGPFLKLCEKAHAQPTRKFTLFIDEINRANVAKVFGELITAIEPSKRVAAGSAPQADSVGVWLTLPNTDEPFGVPDNLDIVATMNTADRSIAMMDVALRRRFAFRECAPDAERISPRFVGRIDLRKLLRRINDRLEFLLDRDHAIGHTYFIGVDSLPSLQRVLADRVIPLLHEYFFEDLDKVSLVLTGSTKDSAFFRSRTLQPAHLFPDERHSLGTETRRSFEIGDPAAWAERDIMRLYGATPDEPESASS